MADRPPVPPNTTHAGRGRLMALALLAALAVPASAPAQDSPSCPREGVSPRDYLDCLGNTAKESERALERAYAGALAAIRADDSISAPQRARWANLMEEAQGRFVHWRNFECQSIAPYEGGAATQTVGGRLGGIGSLEQRLTCLTIRNAARADDLARRYPPPAGWTHVEPAPPEPLPATVVAPPSGPVRIIEMPGTP